MTQEEKELLLQDLCARLPYGVKIHHGIPTLLISIKSDRDGMKIITEGSYGEHIFDIEDIKPYLRPMSSMTEEEKELSNYFVKDIMYCGDVRLYMNRYIDWLNRKHFDWRMDGNNKTLIERGLALEAPEGMYN